MLRNITSVLSTPRFFSQLTDSTIPGLRFIPNLLEQNVYDQLNAESFRLRSTIRKLINPDTQMKTATYLSKQHNLDSDEYYQLMSLNDVNDKKIYAQHFEQYGEDGHTLTYFQNNSNIPEFIRSGLIASIEKLPEIAALSNPERPLNWKFTFNTYRPPQKNPNQLSGFDFHVDTADNGEITMIYTLIFNVELQMKESKTSLTTKSFNLIPNSLLLLSGDSRWKWLHRVVAKDISACPEIKDCDEKIYRISLVLGCC